MNFIRLSGGIALLCVVGACDNKDPSVVTMPTIQKDVCWGLNSCQPFIVSTPRHPTQEEIIAMEDALLYRIKDDGGVCTSLRQTAFALLWGSGVRVEPAWYPGSGYYGAYNYHERTIWIGMFFDDRKTLAVTMIHEVVHYVGDERSEQYSTAEQMAQFCLIPD